MPQTPMRAPSGETTTGPGAVVGEAQESPTWLPRSSTLANHHGYFEWTRTRGIRDVALWEPFASLDPEKLRLGGWHLNE